MRLLGFIFCWLVALPFSARAQTAPEGSLAVTSPVAERDSAGAVPAFPLPTELEMSQHEGFGIDAQSGRARAAYNQSQQPFGDLQHAAQDHARFDFIGPYEPHPRGVFEPHEEPGHSSSAGYPFVHGLSMEIDFVERALEFDLIRSRGTDDGAANELEFESELVWAINSRMILIAGTPLASVDPLVGSRSAGLGDIDFAFQYLAYGGRRSLLFTLLKVNTPTGDFQRDLGAGHTTLEPTMLWLYDFLDGTYFQSRWGWEMPVSTTDVGSKFHYDMGFYHTILATRNWRIGRFFTPIIETNGLTRMNEAGYGRTVVDLTAGFRFLLRGSDEVGFGYSFPVSGAREFNDQFRFSYRLHF